MNSSACLWRARSDATSRQRASSSAQESSRNALRLLSSSARAEWYNCSTRRQRSGFITFLTAHFAQEPYFRQSPVSLHRFDGHSQDVRGLLHAQPSKKAKFHNLALTPIDVRQGIKRVVQSHDVRVRLAPWG